MYFDSLNLNECCGCGACQLICRENAISMISRDGYCYPQIDENRCIHCNMCRKVCEEKNQAKKIELKDAYYGWSSNLQQRESSTSGGAFPALAASFLRQHNNNAIVYGAVYSADFQVQHIGASKENELSQMCRSKYVQSDARASYMDVKKNLESGVYVLFSGTPCQVAGLKAYLQKQYDRLYTIDIICHGVSNPLLFRNHIRDLSKKYNSNVKQFFFRSKDKAKKKNSLRYIDVFFENGKKRHTTCDRFYMTYHARMFYRPACYACAFASPKRCSDITLGDYWGIESVYPELGAERRKGISLVLCNTQRGKILLEQSSDQLYLAKGDYNCALKGQMNAPTVETKPIKKINYESDSFYNNTKGSIPIKVFINYYYPELYIMLGKIKRKLRI